MSNQPRDCDDDDHRWRDRRRTHELSDDQMEDLATRIAKISAPMAAELAKNLVIDHIALTVGRSIISKLAWAVGIAFIGVALWLAGTGHIKP